jgi:hypothetical protein
MEAPYGIGQGMIENCQYNPKSPSYLYSPRPYFLYYPSNPLTEADSIGIYSFLKKSTVTEPSFVTTDAFPWYLAAAYGQYG